MAKVKSPERKRTILPNHVLTGKMPSTRLRRVLQGGRLRLGNIALSYTFKGNMLFIDRIAFSESSRRKQIGIQRLAEEEGYRIYLTTGTRRKRK